MLTPFRPAAVREGVIPTLAPTRLNSALVQSPVIVDAPTPRPAAPASRHTGVIVRVARESAPAATVTAAAVHGQGRRTKTGRHFEWT